MQSALLSVALFIILFGAKQGFLFKNNDVDQTTWSLKKVANTYHEWSLRG